VKALLAALALLLLSALDVAAEGAEPYKWRVPAWLPPPLTPDFNRMSEAKADLGRHLFYDGRLSLDGTLACGSCHQPARAFTDGLARPTGISGATHPRNTMTLANVGYLPLLTWANPMFIRLEQQALMPLFGEAPVEMGMAGQEDEMFARLKADPLYREKFAAAFPERRGDTNRGAIDLGTIVRALAAFQRSLISADSPYDRYRYGGQPDAIPAAARRGEALFFSERLECFHCHGGLHFTDSIVHSAKPLAEIGFHNTGLYNLDGKGAFPPDNQGLFEFTQNPQDMGRFRTPSLRNVTRTAPYMHDGSIATLREAVAHYAAGGRSAGNGADSPLKSPFMIGFQLADAEIDDLLAFLESLTDEGFLSDPAFADPWPAGHPARADRRSDGG
jgi:cytochrome c peroxidase